MPDPDVEQNSLSDLLKLLADPNRLDLLRQLREPKIVDEIQMTPSRSTNETNPERQLTRQAVRHHLRQLREKDFVRVSARRRPDGREVSEFEVNEQAFYGLVEDLHNLNEYISTSNGHAPMQTSSHTEQDDGWPMGPKLVLVRGLHDGHPYMLTESQRDPPRGWVIGRADHCAVHVGYDPYVADEDAEIMPNENGNGYELIDLRSSNDSAVVNGSAVPFGGKTELDHGDVIKVGSSMFVFHEK